MLFTKVVSLTLVIAAVTVLSVSAEMVVCGTATRFDQYGYFDPARPIPPNCSVVPDALTASQLSLILNAQLSNIKKVKLIKVVPAAPNGLVVDMTAQEKQAVNDAEVVEQNNSTALASELTNNQACANTTLAQIETYLDNRMANITTAINNIPTVTVSGTVVITAAATKTALQNMINEVDTRDRAILRCLLARSAR